jgi:hypothetical protein
MEIQAIESSKREKQLTSSKKEDRKSKERLRKKKQLNQLIVDLVSQFDSFTTSTSFIHHLQAC